MRRLQAALTRTLLTGLLLGLGSSSGCTPSGGPGVLCPDPPARGPALPDSVITLTVAHSLSETWMAVEADGLKRIPGEGLTGRAPNDLDVVGSRLLVVNSLENSIQFVDLGSGATLYCLSTGTGSNPWELVPDPFQPNRAYITTFLSGEVLEVDLDGPAITRRVTVGPALEGLAVTETSVVATLTGFNGTEGQFDQGHVVFLDKTSLLEVARLPVPTNPQFVLPGPDGRLHVICTGNYGTPPRPVAGSVVRVEADGSAVLDTLALGGSPGRAALAPDGTMFVAAIAGGLMSYHGDSFTALRDATHPIEGSSGYTDVVVDGDRVYAINFDLDALIAFDRNTLVPVADRLTGDGPIRLAAYRP